MQQRLPSLLDPPIAFAHRGARAHARENTLEAFELARRLGATGLESDVWTTADGVPVLDHDGVVKKRFRRSAIGTLRRDELPDHIPTLDDLLDGCGAGVPLSLDVKDGEFDAVAATVRSHDHAENTWLCHPSLEMLTTRRDELQGLRLVHSTRRDKLDVSPELHASRLAAAGIDAVNFHHSEWSGGLVVMFHRFGVHTFGWDLHLEHQLSSAIRMGLDAVYSDHVDVMMDVLHSETG